MIPKHGTADDLFLSDSDADDISLNYSSTVHHLGLDLATPAGLGLPKQHLTLVLNAYAEQMVTGLMQFLYGCAGFPTQNRHFAGWPGLTVERVNEHLPKSTETVKGQLKLI